MITENYQLILKEKKNIRKKIRNTAAKSTKQELQWKNTLIEKNLYSLSEYFKARTIHIYISSFCCEVDTFPIIKNFIKKNGKVIVPIVNEEKHELIHSELKSLNRLKRSRFNIWEPEDKYITNPNNIDLIVVPCVALDLKGNRLGYGKGYYDRFLTNTDAPKIALAYELQIIDNIPITNNDIPVNIIVTENRIIRI